MGVLVQEAEGSSRGEAEQNVAELMIAEIQNPDKQNVHPFLKGNAKRKRSIADDDEGIEYTSGDEKIPSYECLIRVLCRTNASPAPTFYYIPVFLLSHVGKSRVLLRR